MNTTHKTFKNKVQADANTLYKLYLLRGIKRYSPHLENIEDNTSWIKYIFQRLGRYLLAKSYGESKLFPAINNVAEHSLLVVYIAMILAKYQQENAGNIAIMASLHDVPEVLTGDATPHSKPFLQVDEKGAWEEIVSNSTFDSFTPDFVEYETRKTLSAKIVKSADIISTVIEMRMAHAQGNKYPSYRDKNLDGTAILRQRLEELEVEGAVELFDCLNTTSPFDWVRKGNNSFSNGNYGK